MVNGKVGRWLAIGLVVALPLERLLGGLFAMVPADLFLMMLIVAAWPVLWQQRTRVRFPLILAMWLVVGSGLIGTMAWLDVGTALLTLVQEIYLFVAFLTLANTIIDDATYLMLSKVWLVAAAVESVFLIMGRVGIGPAYFHVLEQRGDAGEMGRSLGTFINANAAGGYMVISLFVLLAVPYPRNRLLRAGLFALYAAAVVATGSNSSLLGMAVGLVVAVVYWMHRRGSGALLALGLGMLVASLIVVGLFALSTVEIPLEAKDTSSTLAAFTRPEDKLDKRLFLWDSGLEYFREHPLGIGPAVSITLVEAGLHNDYLAFLVERGPLGLIALAVLWGETLFWMVLADRNSTTPAQIRATGAYLGVLIGLLVIASTHEVTHARSVWVLWSFIYLHYRFTVGNKQAEPLSARLAGSELSGT